MHFACMQIPECWNTLFYHLCSTISDCNFFPQFADPCNRNLNSNNLTDLKSFWHCCNNDKKYGLYISRDLLTRISRKKRHKTAYFLSVLAWGFQCYRASYIQGNMKLSQKSENTRLCVLKFLFDTSSLIQALNINEIINTSNCAHLVFYV